MSNLTIGIECLTFNRLYYTQQTLPELYKRTKCPAKIILMDNASVDGTREFVQGFQSAKYSHIKTKKIFYNRNIGIAPALNDGLKHLQGYDLITFMANDIILPEGWDKAIIEVFGARKDIGLVGFNGPDHIRQQIRIQKVKDYTISVMPFVGGAITIRKKILTQMKGWPASTYRYGGVDGQARAKLIKQGYKCCFINELHYVHLETGDRRRYRDYCMKKFRIQGKLGGNVQGLIKAIKGKPFIEKTDHWDLEDV